MSHILNGPCWVIRCDRPGCVEFIDGTGSSEHEQKRTATALAYEQGWQLSNHGDVPLDFCAVHVDHTRSVRLGVSPLFDEFGQPVLRQRRA